MGQGHVEGGLSCVIRSGRSGADRCAYGHARRPLDNRLFSRLFPRPALLSGPITWTRPVFFTLWLPVRLPDSHIEAERGPRAGGVSITDR